MKKVSKWVVWFMFIMMLTPAAATLYSSEGLRPTATVTVPSSPIAESPDFATRVLRDPWDMSEFSDISQYLNVSNQQNVLQNFQVGNGIFSAQSTATNDAHFFPLFPGYNTAMLIGKVGARYPIASTTFHCLYIATKVDANAGNDIMQIFWFADEKLNGAGGVWGASAGVALYPEAGGGAPTRIWKLHRVDLATITAVAGTGWTGRSTWGGLRIDPTNQANVTFAVDWIRLTDCTANNQTITWTPNASITAMYLRPVGSTNYIRVASGLSGNSGSAALDISGLAPGSYYVGMGTTSTCCIDENTTTPLVINQSPIAHFARPSFTSGVDYATQAGNAWDFSNSSDAIQVNEAPFSYHDGVLDMTTASGGAIPDPQVILNTPQVVASANTYRYLTFRMFTAGALQDVPRGMIIRWIWRSNSCYMVSQDIPFDVGWQTLTIDLFHPFNGSVEETQGPCPGGALHWTTTTAINLFRFDPNENITGAPMRQQLDWIKLTTVDRVNRGTPFPVRITLNKPPDSTTFTFYYTTDLTNPTQNTAAAYSASPVTPPGSNRVYIPLVVRDYEPLANDYTFLWDTAAVAAGTYYICVTANDGVNAATYCSEAPVQVN